MVDHISLQIPLSLSFCAFGHHCQRSDFSSLSAVSSIFSAILQLLIGSRPSCVDAFCYYRHRFWPSSALWCTSSSGVPTVADRDYVDLKRRRRKIMAILYPTNVSLIGVVSPWSISAEGGHPMHTGCVGRGGGGVQCHTAFIGNSFAWDAP